MSGVIIFGLKENAEVAHYYLKNDSKHNIVAFTADAAYIKDDNFCGLPVVPFETIHKQFPADQFSLFAPLGPSDLNSIRAKKYEEGKRLGYRFISYTHSKAVVNASFIGENCFILEQNVIQPFSRIGNNVILWSGNHIGHHSVIEDHCFIASHVVVSGRTTIGESSFLGVNSTIRDGVKIGKRNIIGAGAIVMADTKDGEIFQGTRSKASSVTIEKFSPI